MVMVSTVRNNQKMGRHALGILGDRRRMNVHKLVLVTSTGFLRNAVNWAGPGHDLEFLGSLLRRIDVMVSPDAPEVVPTASIIACGEDGKVIQ